MGMLIDGVWQSGELMDADSKGKFLRKASRFRNWITADGSAGVSGEGGYKAEPGRYHLYVSYACPWASRALMMRRLKGLEDIVGLSVVHWFMAEDGWTFEPGDGVIADPWLNADFLHQIYTAADADYTGRVSVPVLWDSRSGTIVSNESSEIIRMFNDAFDAVGAAPGDYYPEKLRAEIDPINERVFETLNNGVYKCGFATTQAAYEEAVFPLFDTLDWLEERLSRHRYVAGSVFSEADIRLFPTLVRFDAVYVAHFKCNLRRLIDYPNLWNYTLEIYQMPAVKPTVNFPHIKQHYFASHAFVNPTRIVPAGPLLDFETPHDRAKFD